MGVALPEAAFFLPYTIFILRPFLRAVPGELEDAAVVDGASRFKFFRTVLIPLSRPALTTVAIFSFIASWNAYLLPLLVFNDRTITRSRWAWPVSRAPIRKTQPESWHSPRCPWSRRWRSSSSPSGALSAALRAQ